MLSKNRSDFNYTLEDDEKKALDCIAIIERRFALRKLSFQRDTENQSHVIAINH